MGIISKIKNLKSKISFFILLLILNIKSKISFFILLLILNSFGLLVIYMPYSPPQPPPIRESTQNPYHDNLNDYNYSITGSFNVYSRDEKILVRVFYLFGINKPQNGYGLVFFKTTIAPLYYDFTLFDCFFLRDSFFDYFQFEVTQLMIVSDTEVYTSHSFDEESELYRTHSTSNLSSIGEFIIKIPNDWQNSTSRSLTLVVGNFKVIDGYETYQAYRSPNIDPETASSLFGVELSNFHFSQENASSEYNLDLYTTIQVSLVQPLFPKIFLTTVIVISVFVLISIFDNDDKKRKTSLRRDYLKDKELEIEIEDIEKHIKEYSEKCFGQSGIFFGATISLLFSLASYFVVHIWSSLLLAQYYVGGGIVISAALHFWYIYETTKVKKKENEIIEKSRDNVAIRCILKEIKEDSKISTKEITSTIAIIIALILFLTGNLGFKSLI